MGCGDGPKARRRLKQIKTRRQRRRKHRTDSVQTEAEPLGVRQFGYRHRWDERNWSVKQLSGGKSPSLPTVDVNTWPMGPVLDQLDTPQCVGYAWRGWLEATCQGTVAGQGPSAEQIYLGAQKLDEWQGEDYEGSSVLGGAKWLRKQGVIESYYFSTNVEEIVQTLLSHGPLVIGSSWWSSMTSPRVARNGRRLLLPRGEMLGGHAYLLTACDAAVGWCKVRNSWGEEWEDSFIALRNLRLLLTNDFEACYAVRAEQKQDKGRRQK